MKTTPALGIQAHGITNAAQTATEAINSGDSHTAGRALAHLQLVVESTQIVIADQLRREGASWADVGKALGISRQAAQQRYGR